MRAMSADSLIRVGRRDVRRKRGSRWTDGWLASIPLLAAARAVFSSARHFFRSLRGGADGRFVVPVSEAQVARPAAFRGMPVLVARSDGRARCVACELCARVCPAACIDVEADPEAGDGLDGRPLRFELDMGRCIFCGLCEEACPVEAIVMSPHVENAAFERAALRYSLEQLLVPSELLEPRLRFLRERREASGEGTVPLLRLVASNDGGAPSEAP